jgi:hypothetical protein
LLFRAKHLFVAARTVVPVITRRSSDQLGLGLGNRLKRRSCQGSCVGRLRAASFRDSCEACYFFPRGGGQADRVRAVDLAANNVLDVLRRPDASPAAVLGVVVAKVKTEAAA